jgi:hypothetical protein
MLTNKELPHSVAVGLLGMVVMFSTTACEGREQMSERQVLRLAQQVPAIQALLETYGSCEGCAIPDTPENRDRIGCVEYAVKPLAGGEWSAEFWVGDVCNFRYGGESPHLQVTVDPASQTARLVSPPERYVLDHLYCDRDADCFCLSGSGMPVVGCANYVHGPTHFAGAYRCRSDEGPPGSQGNCVCVNHQCEHVE